MRSARMSARLVAVVAVVAALFTPIALIGCGGDDGTADAPSRTPSVADKPSFPAPSDTPSPRGVARIDVAGHLVVARADGTGWALWRVTPSTAVERRIGDLPSTPTDALASPDGRRVAYLVPPRPALDQVGVAVLETDTGAIDLLPQKGSGLWGADGMTWLSSTKLLVSGPRSKAARSYPIDDALRVYDLRSGEVEPFGGGVWHRAECGVRRRRDRVRPPHQAWSGAEFNDRPRGARRRLAGDWCRDRSPVRRVHRLHAGADDGAAVRVARRVAHPDGPRRGATRALAGVLWRRERTMRPLWTRETSMAYPLTPPGTHPDGGSPTGRMSANVPVAHVHLGVLTCARVRGQDPRRLERASWCPAASIGRATGTWRPVLRFGTIPRR